MVILDFQALNPLQFLADSFLSGKDSTCTRWLCRIHFIDFFEPQIYGSAELSRPSCRKTVQVSIPLFRLEAVADCRKQITPSLLSSSLGVSTEVIRSLISEQRLYTASSVDEIVIPFLSFRICF